MKTCEDCSSSYEEGDSVHTNICFGCFEERLRKRARESSLIFQIRTFLENGGSCDEIVRIAKEMSAQSILES
jgi:hypothetical protein